MVKRFLFAAALLAALAAPAILAGSHHHIASGHNPPVEMLVAF